MYRRSTREIALTELPPPLADALRRHAEAHQLVLATVRAWWTDSENPPAEGFLGRLLGRRANPVDPDSHHVTVLVLHATHALVLTSGERRGISVVSLPLAVASVTRGSVVGARTGVAAPRDGVSITGFPGQVGSPGTLYVGLGPEPAGEACAAALEAAVSRIKNPA